MGHYEEWYGGEGRRADTLEKALLEKLLGTFTGPRLKQEGFGVLSEIDVQATLKKKLDVDFRRYVILGACNPPLAKGALDADPEIGLLPPCNVLVQDAGVDEIAVWIADPKAMFTLTDNADVAPVAAEAEARLRRVIDALANRREAV